VDLFAPAGIPVWAPNNEGVVGLNDYYGTSASTPYTAGVAAMLFAANPELTPDEVGDILLRTARTLSPDPLVNRTLNAIDAVREVFERRFPEDRLEPNNSSSTATSTLAIAVPGVVDFGDVSLHTSTEVDYYRFVVNDWMGVRINLELSNVITDIEPIFTRVGGGTAPVRVAYDLYPHAKVQQYTGLSPGEYLLTIRHGSSRPASTRREVVYRLSLVFDRESAPEGDMYEDNYNRVTAFRFDNDRGTYRATLHTTSDEDFYRFDVGSFLESEGMTFAIRTSDQPVQLTLFDNRGTQVADSLTGSIGSIGTGTWYIRVRQPSRLITRYTFTTLGAVPVDRGTASRFSPVPDRVWRILIALGSIDMSIIRGAEYLLIPTGPRPEEFTFFGNVDAELLDWSGGSLGVSRLVLNGQGVFNSVLSMASAPADEEVLIRVTPRGFDASIVDEREWASSSFPEEPFFMNWRLPN
jgi:hypothetical protein